MDSCLSLVGLCAVDSGVLIEVGLKGNAVTVNTISYSYNTVKPYFDTMFTSS